MHQPAIFVNSFGLDSPWGNPQVSVETKFGWINGVTMAPGRRYLRTGPRAPLMDFMYLTHQA